MDELSFNYGSTRAEKARLGVWLSGWRGRLLPVVAGVVGVVGAVCLVLGLAFGWLVLGIAVLPVMLSVWYKGELSQPAVSHAQTIDGLLAADVLGRLPKNPSPYDIATAVGQVRGGQFYGARFGITAAFLQQIASKDPVDTAAVWRLAVEARNGTKQEFISAAVLVVALVQAFPDHEALLAHMQLDSDELGRGVEWQQHISDLVAYHSRPKRTGGIARDWSFGYTPLLSRFGQNISEQIARNGLISVELEAHQEALDQLLGNLGQDGRQNVALIGPQGVGKTTVVRVFAERLLDGEAKIPSNLRFRQVFLLDASALISAAPKRGELEGLVTQILNEAYAAKNIIICLDNAGLFFEEGIGSVDLSNLLQPIIEAGRLRLILTMDEQRYLKLSARNAALASSLNRVNVAPANETETLRVMQDQLIITEFQRHVTYTYQALKEAYRLSQRYLHELAMPGRAIRLMEAAAGYAENGLVTINSVQQAIEKTMDVKVGVASSDDERDKLLNLEQLIHQRMINQTRAVSVVSDAIRRARAGVRNQDRPIGTFLFLGPTGVGKTELSKALADVYFGGENRLIRVDMNEYVRSEDVSRLIADGADDPMSLTAQVMKQPFSVVLLDEIEKAHPEVLTTLLQLLDEGILRDIKNREVSFRDAIIIATSNAGADRIREYIERGYQLEQFEQQLTDELINSNQFRPEFLNRFDEIVVFRPLKQDELFQVVDLILAGVNKTLALQKITVAVADDAKAVLVERGYDPRLGARPLRRVVQRAVENTVAKQMLSGSVAPGSTITITREQVEQILGSHEAAKQIVDTQPTPPSIESSPQP